MRKYVFLIAVLAVLFTGFTTFSSLQAHEEGPLPMVQIALHEEGPVPSVIQLSIV